MKQLFKYQGGKSREMKFIRTLLPETFKRSVEPFSGSAAFSVMAGKPALLGDLDAQPITVFQVLQSNRATELKERLEWAERLPAPDKSKSKEELNTYANLYSEYYRQRDEAHASQDPVDIAFRFLFLRQLCFSGMVRISSKTGRSNVPFGWYTKFSSNILSQWDDVIAWAKQSEANVQGYEKTLLQTTKNDFVFLDPPYLDRRGYHAEGFDLDVTMHQKMSDMLKNVPCPWMLIHVDCKEYRDMFSWARIEEKPFNYSMNFKGRDNTKSKVNHLYILNP
jgi:DNA adenine methylase